jgi:ADP-ribose pyrophosphatase YjhB (NUDIX family)
MTIENFNIRVYGILKRSNGDILLTDEIRSGVEMTKFVGGGLEFGEGIADCLKREFKEEMGVDIEIKELFYINDFLQVSAFNLKDQLISIYYYVTTSNWQQINHCINHPINKQSFKWVSLEKLSSKDVTFPIDKVVVEKLISL